MAKEVKKLNELFLDTLKDVYFAESKIVEVLPKMQEATSSSQLKSAFEKHLGETEIHVARLEQVFEMIGEKPEKKTWAAILDITDEGDEIMPMVRGISGLMWMAARCGLRG